MSEIEAKTAERGQNGRRNQRKLREYLSNNSLSLYVSSPRNVWALQKKLRFL